MNWDRASREYRWAQATDYMAREDELDRRVYDDGRRGRVKKRKRSGTQQKPVGTGAASSVFNGSDKLASRLRQNLKRDAAELGIAKEQLAHLREKALRRGWPLEAILDGRAIAKGGEIRTPPAAKPLQPSGRVIKSRGAPGETRKRPAPHPNRLQKPPRKKKSKQERAAAEANKRGISVEQLMEERRRQARENNELAAKAKALGITTKALRQRLGVG